MNLWQSKINKKLLTNKLPLAVNLNKVHEREFTELLNEKIRQVVA